jgi:choline dehydrogenase
MTPIRRVDYIVIGSGSAGAVIANRLSANGRYQILLLEAGGEDRNPWIHVPGGFARIFLNPSTSWGDLGAPEPALHERRLFYPYGKVLGGSSSVNGMVYIRGDRRDYDHWRESGSDGWGFDDVLPYFRRAENQQRGEDQYHGVGGPIKVHDQFEPHELCEAFFAAAREVGIPGNRDFNGADCEGAGYYQLTTDGWRRCSTAVGYLRPARRRSNLTILVNAQVRRVLLENARAVGIEFTRDGQAFTAMASREVVLSAGAFNSPHLLQLSGIGPAQRLRAAGITVAHDLPGVGENAEDHYMPIMTYESTKPTANDAVRTRLGKSKALWNYLVRRTGLMTIGAAYGGGFFRAVPGSVRPDVQCFFMMYSSDDYRNPSDYSGFSVGIFQSRPTSKGWVRTTSADPNARPEIRLNYLSTQNDQQYLLAGLALARRIMEAPALKSYVRRRVKPAPEVMTDDEMLEWARENGNPSYHVTGTCRMGTDALSVVDTRLRVRGISGLRVADASIMPSLVSGNTNAPCIMIGEKASDLILEDAGAVAYQTQTAVPWSGGGGH